MKRAFIVINILAVLLIGCANTDNEVVTNQIKQEETEEMSQHDYEQKIKEFTDKEIHKMIVEDFGNDGIKEAVILVMENADEEAIDSEFELWFLTSDKSEKIADSFIGAISFTSIELFKTDEKYIIFNMSQTRENDEMKTFIYRIENNEVIESFSQKRMNLVVENNEIYAYDSSYCVFEPEFEEWMSLAEQKYHFKWDDETKTCKEYCANVISEAVFMNMTNAKELKELIYNQLNEVHSKNMENIEYEYLLREDNTVDVNLIVTMLDKVKYKYYVTAKCNDNILETTEIELCDGNKEESLIKSLNQ